MGKIGHILDIILKDKRRHVTHSTHISDSVLLNSINMVADFLGMFNNVDWSTKDTIRNIKDKIEKN